MTATMVRTGDGDEPDETWCAYHNVNEPRADGPVCGECWHQYLSDEDLIDTHMRKWAEMDLLWGDGGGVRPRPTSAREIFSCPLCIHDF